MFVEVTVECACFGSVVEFIESDLDVFGGGFTDEVLGDFYHLFAVIEGLWKLEVEVEFEHSLFDDGRRVNVVAVARKKSVQEMGLTSEGSDFLGPPIAPAFPTAFSRWTKNPRI